MKQLRACYVVPLSALFIVVACAVADADNAVIVFTSRVHWATAVGNGVITEDFETSPLGLLPIGTTQLGMIAFTTDDSGPIAPRIEQPGQVNGTRDLFGRVDNRTFGGTFHTISFPFDAIAFGADFDSTTTGDGLEVTVGAAMIRFSDHLSGPGDGFLGVISDAPFDSITFRPVGLPLGEGFSVDNLSFRAVPEPSSAILAVIAAAIGGRRITRQIARRSALKAEA